MHKRLEYAALGLLLGILSAQAGHWLIRPHPDASTAGTVLVVVQLVVGCCFFLWAIWKMWRISRTGRVKDQAKR